MLRLCAAGQKQYIPKLVNHEFVMFNSDAFNLLYTSSKTIMVQINAITCFLQLISVTQLIINNNNNN